MENDILTSELKGQRTLATVVFTDCVGFSARMSINEDHTLDLIRRDLKLMKQLCERSEGRVLKSTGDGLLMCFVSAVKAVEYAIAIQKTLTERTASLSPEDALQHRIGIHLADIFINETDVMGNGVNIAARLQTLAPSGGICISQTVYDVVKAGLDLETRYLGPQELKNIREIVPTYRIVLNPEAEADPYIEITHNLEQNIHALRIKKLLFYACRNVWESNQDRLNLVDLKLLLQEALRLAPTTEQLQLLLDTVVKTLSKPGEYALIAKTIVDEVSRLHFNLQQQSSITQANVQLSPASEWSSLYGQLAQALDQAGDPIRIKKLVFYTCRRRWENSLDELGKVPLANLLEELHHMAPNGDRLRTLLGEFVQTLSKKAEYTLIANTISSHLQQLYEAPHSTLVDSAALPPLAPDPLIYTEIATSLEQDPNLIRIKKLILYVCRRQWQTDPNQLDKVTTVALVQELHLRAPTPEQLETILYTVVRSLSKPDEYMAIARTIANKLIKLYLPALDTVESGDLNTDAPAPMPTLNSTPESPPSPTAPNSINLFDSRLGIMKYINPLRAKILLFAVVHGNFTYSEQDWFNLKLVEIDGLIQQLLEQCSAYTDLEASLFQAAHQLQQPEEAIQAATDIIKCLRPFYLHKGSALLQHSTEESSLNLDVFEQNTLEISHAADAELTCQLLDYPTDEPNATHLNFDPGVTSRLTPPPPIHPENHPINEPQ